MTGRPARVCDCPGCSCVGVSRDYMRALLEDDHPAVQAAARVALADGWTCDTHEPLPWGECRDCTQSHLRTARRALTAALPHLPAATLGGDE